MVVSHHVCVGTELGSCARTGALNSRASHPSTPPQPLPLGFTVVEEEVREE